MFWLYKRCLAGKFVLSVLIKRFVRENNLLSRSLILKTNMLVFSTASTEYVRCKGQIQVIFGPMFSGKTTELIRRLKRYQVANHKCLIIKYANDLRYEAVSLSTHDSQTLSAVSATTLSDLKDEAANYSIIGIDEGQFFPDTVSFAEAMANAGKVVIVAALDGTFQRKSFGNILDLVPLAESVIKLTAVCMICFEEASFTRRIGSETKLEVIGGRDKYMAVCRRCYGKGTLASKVLEQTESEIILSQKNSETS